jgi:predicted DsbA family dithiol-disulfide isomerase
LVEELFQAHHEQERDISDRDVLRQIAVDAGLDKKEVDSWLESNVIGNVVDADAARNRELVNSGVPRFVIQGVHRIDGAQDPSDFLEVFVKVKEGGE